MVKDVNAWAEYAFRKMVNEMPVERFNELLKESPPEVALKMVAVRMGCI